MQYMCQIDGIYCYHLYCACMKIHQLRALVAIAVTGSFTAAAHQLGISQSSLSHAISELESELNLLLFDRGRQGAQTTEASRRILPYARHVLESLNSIHAEAQSLAGLLGGRVRIGSVPSAAVAFLPNVIANFSRQYPDVEVVLLEEPSQGMQQLVDWLDDNIIDLAVLEMPIANLNVVPLMKDELLVIVPSSSPLATLKRVSILDIAKEPFVMSRYNSERLVREAYAQHKLSPVVRFEVQDLGTLVSMVREGLGISIVPKMAFSSIPEGVALIPIRPRIQREVAVAVRSIERAAPATRAFIVQAQESARRRVDGKYRS